jgi:hypothetical protein
MKSLGTEASKAPAPNFLSYLNPVINKLYVTLLLFSVNTFAGKPSSQLHDCKHIWLKLAYGPIHAELSIIISQTDGR